MSCAANSAPRKENPMRRIVLTLVAAAAALTALASPALASTDVQVQMSFTEPAINPNCTVDPYGPATETIAFGAGCGGTCDLRTVYLSNGTLVIDERALGDGTCPGPPGPYCRPSNGQVFKPFIDVPLSDTIVGGTGIFQG